MVRTLAMASVWVISLAAAHPTCAQVMPGMPQKPSPAQNRDPVGHDMAGHDMAGMEGMDMSSHTGHAMMSGALGAYAMTRDASGTAWQPDAEPHAGLHSQLAGWTTMLHGYATAIYDNQGGPRGDTQGFVQSHLMAMAQRPIGSDTLTLHGAISIDPLMGKGGYPLLLQTGETADGRTPLIDRQHPHNFFSELSATYRHPVSSDTAVFAYVGYPGEPAIGPVTYLHRFAGMANPETPITHHWLDSTHIAFGVVTVGVTRGPFKLEASRFTGREPDQHRWAFNGARLDSGSARLTYNPTPNWSMQISYADIHSPEQLTPTVNQKRTTASVTYFRPITDGDWETTVAWGLDRNQPGHALNGYLVESALRVGANTLFGRAENAQKDELFRSGDRQDGRLFDVSKFSVGYFRTLGAAPHVALDLGGLVSGYALPSSLNATYGAHPVSFMLFARVKIT